VNLCTQKRQDKNAPPTEFMGKRIAALVAAGLAYVIRPST